MFKGAQDGIVGVQPVLPESVQVEPVQAPHRLHEGRYVLRAQRPAAVHVSGRSAS